MCIRDSYTAGGADVTASKGVTVRSTNALPCANLYFNHCQFTGFARLVDLSYDVKNVRFNDCDFSVAYYGAMIGETMDGSTAGLTDGPRDVQFESSSWETISQQAIYVKPTAGADSGVGQEISFQQETGMVEKSVITTKGLDQSEKCLCYNLTMTSVLQI